MIQRIKDSLLLVCLLALAVVTYMFGRRGEKISALQDEVIRKDLIKELDRSLTAVETGEKSYEEALRSYHAKRDRYNKLFWSKSKP